MAWAPLFLSAAFAIGTAFLAYRLAVAAGDAPRWSSFLRGIPGWEGRGRPWIVALQRRAGDFDRTPEGWAGYAAACGAGGLLGGAAVGGPLGGLGGAFSAFLPLALLSSRADRRLAAVEREFPFVVDLVGLAVAGGMTVEWSLRRVVPRLPEGPLQTELARLLAERAVGQAWPEVLAGLAERTGSGAVRETAATLAQAESTGMSLAPILARLSADLRERKLAASEAKAHRAPVRMLFPIVLCILPAVFAVLLAPVLSRMLG